MAEDPIVLSDTSPLIGLAAAGCFDVLRELFGAVSITESVQRTEAGAKLDFKKTVDDDVSKMKKQDVYKDVKVDRDRIKDLPGGEMVQYTFTEQSRPRKQFYIVGERDGDLPGAAPLERRAGRAEPVVHRRAQRDPGARLPPAEGGEGAHAWA